MNKRLILDADVLIDYQRGHPAAIAYFRGLGEQPAIPAIVLAELYAGVRDGEERLKLDRLAADIPVLALSAEMAVRGGLYRRQYGKSHGCGFNDCLVAAAVELEGGRLVTLNQKHFPMLADVLVPYQKA